MKTRHSLKRYKDNIRECYRPVIFLIYCIQWNSHYGKYCQMPRQHYHFIKELETESFAFTTSDLIWPIKWKIWSFFKQDITNYEAKAYTPGWWKLAVITECFNSTRITGSKWEWELVIVWVKKNPQFNTTRVQLCTKVVLTGC